jgi:C_GCAxxG_C_C family probable redox protein
MADLEALKARVEELRKLDWDRAGIEARLKAFSEKGIPKKKMDTNAMIAAKEEILDRVQQRGEEYEYVSHNCAKGSALAVMEEFGLGKDMEIIKALSPFPGFGMTGWICGGVTGGLMALGLFFGSNDVTDYDATGRAMTAARKFIPRFEQAFGTILCPKIHEEVIFDRYMDPRASEENFEAFKEAEGYERCALPPGIGARIAAEIIIESMKKKQG